MEDDQFWAHFLVGMFLCGFGLAFLGLTAARLRRMVVLSVLSEGNGDDDHDDDETTNAGGFDTTTTKSTSHTTHTAHHHKNPVHNILLRKFLEAHVPEQSPTVLRRTSVALMVSTLLGIAETMIGARFFFHEQHPTFGVFHYAIHLSISLLFVLVGWTGFLEYKGYLPADSLRAALAFGLGMEAFAFWRHASNKTDPLDAELHRNIAVLAGPTALITTASVLLGHNSNFVVTSFVLYLGVFVGLVWQGLWWLAIAFHRRGYVEIISVSHATALLVVQGAVLVVICQLVVISMVKLYNHRIRRTPQDREERHSLVRDVHHNGEKQQQQSPQHDPDDR